MDTLGSAFDRGFEFDAPGGDSSNVPEGAAAPESSGALGTPQPSRRRVVAAGIAGFVLGGVVLGVLWAVSGAHAGASDDAKAACAALDRVGDVPNTVGTKTGVTDIALTQDRLHRMTAARELADAAATDDVTYADLSANMDQVSRMVLSVRFDDPAGQRALAQVQEICTRLS